MASCSTLRYPQGRTEILWKLNSLFEATLQKTGSVGAWEVGGVASSFYKDLDGDAIAPDAIRDAIPGFMARRGPTGIQGGPIRLHHGFWDSFLKKAIHLLHLDMQQQMDLVAAISLPLGRVTQIWVDEGTTHWRGILSQSNPIARTIWGMLQEGVVHLGVSVGGKILSTRPGRDCLGQACTLITKVRLDELSITDNPALRLLNRESAENGAYIAALSKSLSKSLSLGMNSSTAQKSVGKTLRKRAQGSTYGAHLKPAIGMGGSGWTETKTGMGRGLNTPTSQRARGNTTIKMDGTQPKTGLGDKQPRAHRPEAKNPEPKTDVYGLTVGALTQRLEKCCSMTKGALQSPETQQLLTDAAYGLAGITEDPPAALINFVRYLQYFARFAQELPHMDDWQAAGTVEAMGPELYKSLADFKEGITEELKGSPVRPPGSPSIGSPVIMFPQQYVVY